MAHGYKTLHQWNHWLAQHFWGDSLLSMERQVLTSLLGGHIGKHALLIGVPEQFKLLQSIPAPRHTIVGPVVNHTITESIESDLHDIPVLTGSVDLVLLPHTLELIDHPRQLLAEACRIVKPEGLIAISGFNPYSIWGLRKTLAQDDLAPWAGNYIHSHKVKNWLRLADFDLEQQKNTFFRPPIAQQKIFSKLGFIERLGESFAPFIGGAYVLVARAKVIPLTPIRLKWKQQLGSIRVSSSISGHIVRQVK